MQKGEVWRCGRVIRFRLSMTAIQKSWFSAVFLRLNRVRPGSFTVIRRTVSGRLLRRFSARLNPKPYRKSGNSCCRTGLRCGMWLPPARFRVLPTAASATWLGEILSSAPVSRIFTNGATAKRLYDRYIFPETGRPAVLLPSTSPANASWSLDRLKETWRSLLCEP